MTVQNSGIWTRVDSLLNSEASAKHYTIETDLYDRVTIRFGDGIRGKIPPSGELITIDYILSDGTEGNIYTAEMVNTVADTLYDSLYSKIDVLVKNDAPITGGDEAESVEEIRNEAPRVFATGDRAITKADHMALLDNYPSIESSNVWGEAEEYALRTAPASKMNIVNVCVVLGNWTTLADNPTLQNTITDMLSEKAALTVKYEYIEPNIIEVLPTFSVIKVISGNSLATVSSLITASLSAEFNLGTTAKLGIGKKYSNMVRLVDGLTGVSYHHLSMVLQEDMTDEESGYDYYKQLSLTDVKKSTVKVYAVENIADLEGTLVATDDGDGTWTEVDTNYSLDDAHCTLSYTTGVVGLNFSSLPSTVLSMYVRYEQDENGDIIVGKNDILKFKKVVIDSISIDN